MPATIRLTGRYRRAVRVPSVLEREISRPRQLASGAGDPDPELVGAGGKPVDGQPADVLGALTGGARQLHGGGRECLAVPQQLRARGHARQVSVEREVEREL